jgi:hypothetical protein
MTQRRGDRICLVAIAEEMRQCRVSLASVRSSRSAGACTPGAVSIRSGVIVAG